MVKKVLILVNMIWRLQKMKKTPVIRHNGFGILRMNLFWEETRLLTARQSVILIDMEKL
jgi:hypothetical protein